MWVVQRRWREQQERRKRRKRYVLVLHPFKLDLIVFNYAREFIVTHQVCFQQRPQSWSMFFNFILLLFQQLIVCMKSDAQFNKGDAWGNSLVILVGTMHQLINVQTDSAKVALIETLNKFLQYSANFGYPRICVIYCRQFF